MLNSLLTLRTPQIHPSLETQHSPIVLNGGAEVALIVPNNGFAPHRFRYFYQYFWALITKCSGFTDNVHASKHKIYYLTETWLNDTSFSHNVFPASCSVFHGNRYCLNSHTNRRGSNCSFKFITKCHAETQPSNY
jgi:hypothetical protein